MVIYRRKNPFSLRAKRVSLALAVFFSPGPWTTDGPQQPGGARKLKRQIGAAMEGY
jgi:hypothetical protein